MPILSIVSETPVCVRGGGGGDWTGAATLLRRRKCMQKVGSVIPLISRKVWMEDRKEFFKASWGPALAHQKKKKKKVIRTF